VTIMKAKSNLSILFQQLRQMHGVELQGNIVIFDEAHNLVAAMSFEDPLGFIFLFFQGANL
jgi:phosphate starvation-inducible protein PhoH